MGTLSNNYHKQQHGVEIHLKICQIWQIWQICQKCSSWKTRMIYLMSREFVDFNRHFSTKTGKHWCVFDFGFKIGWIHLISWNRPMIHRLWNLLSVKSNLFTHSIFNYMSIVHIYFSLSMWSAHSLLHYPYIVLHYILMIHEKWTAPWIVQLNISPIHG